VCDSAAGETCPVWPGKPITAHWGVADPAAVEGTEEQRRAAFRNAATVLRRRIELFLALPLDKLDAHARTAKLREIGTR
jgi:arsenate reductase